MEKLRIGGWYKVTECSGCDSGRVGILLDWRQFSQDWIQRNEPGRYHPFDPRKESILKDANGDIFTMFTDRLLPTEAGDTTWIDKQPCKGTGKAVKPGTYSRIVHGEHGTDMGICSVCEELVPVHGREFALPHWVRNK